MGQYIDGKGNEIIHDTVKEMLIERKAPGIITRESIHEPLQTGSKH
jgi:F0F1-type ATP synthase alpha subunit